MPDRHLVDEQRRQRQPGGDRDPQPRQRPPPAPPQQPGRLERDREDREVVRRQRQRRKDAPEDQIPARPGQGAEEVERRKGGQEDQEGVVARLLGVPEEHRVDGDQGGGGDAGAAVAQLDAEQVGDRHRRHPGERRERAQADLACPDDLRPEPGEGVVERRRRLAEADRFHRVREVAAQDAAGGDHLVVVVGLRPQGGEAQRRGAERQPGDDPEAARPTQARRRSPSRPRRRRRTPGRCAPARGSRRRRPHCAPARSHA